MKIGICIPPYGKVGVHGLSKCSFTFGRVVIHSAIPLGNDRDTMLDKTDGDNILLVMPYDYDGYDVIDACL